VLLALEDLPDVPLLIQTDSAYVINCCVKFKKMWQANWYTKRDGTSVRNQDVLWPIHHLLDKRTSVRFVKVKGHRRAGGHDRNPLHADAAALARRAARAAAAG
jgi:ribonuclease HI